ncbi:MAG: cation:proton antiporter [Desulfobulbaceae bacterium]|nr:cation:proton antiporter [Desulfobulbaceae bacterium]
MNFASLDISVLTLLGLVALTGFYMGRGAQHLKLPALIGYLFCGAVAGPSVLGIMTSHAMETLSFLPQLGLGFVALTIGSELSISSLKRLGSGIITIILAESFLAFLLCAALLFLWTRDLPLSIILGSLAPASAPAGTVAVIQEVRARGSLTKALYAVVGFDDGLAVIIFGFAMAIAKMVLLWESSSLSPHFFQADLLYPVVEIFFSLLLGLMAAFPFCCLVKNLRDSRDILIILVGFIFLTTGLAIRLDLSLILANMTVGFILVNSREGTLVQRVREPLMTIMPLVYVFFFFLAGAHLDLKALSALGGIGMLYIAGRVIGKIIGVHLGATWGNVDPKIKKYLGLGILSQAGVAIGLSLIAKSKLTQLAVANDFSRAMSLGVTVLTTITATSLFFEIAGPICTRFALFKAGEIPHPSGKGKKKQ